ncbi:MAG: cysteine--tRNA ligase [Candidatus Yanofskybacteria bacterium RIFCSPHIGHO2_02_FULL_44_12b]|uniref:Cysteine--tRNA ligase n=1 Tax=Candidatus Yanofskybacteria bacterium RIFCSPLOWO2_01_FULL_44_22 TaxID=1802697 RepID=A0A1F8GMY1_9BACT|nr:MAG: cysteine--tRNA ligase [Candidatus Yanofskybacteria bacterium RIFCSPHIGHO2_01_FULL_44_24]OGN15636.1 MAG: cysteine--tRNA ligase [Candidatus Yanofskybacteria bacterium RIFCSPHIGHO2_02_FULL_44_12b]OGN26691.1 MAG: cysteine--tRNA ligase [Candidatus Yanofskybacteria bacterium RIFCSPLOWO2_01_FULL_44_22]
MIIHNTLTKTKEKIVPRENKKIQMFVCGPTVYDYIHIGNARTFVFFDVVAKYLKYRGYQVDYIQNITDIDDKIIQRAKENKKDPLMWAKEYRQKFEEDMKALGIDSPKYVPATEHIGQVVKQVKALIDRKHAYLIEGDGWYFDLSTFKDYGKLSGRKAQMADDAVSRIDENDKKRNKGDFCLWKLVKVGKELEIGNWKLEIADGEPAWATPLGWGRPGWHIEDTAITEHYFGPQYDIHGGGQDLIFPHHEAEITQQESASGKKPFVKYWMHVAFLINKEEKMSKSKGNFTTVHELLKQYPKEVLRFYLLSGHYRQPLEFSDKALKQARAGIQRIKELTKKLENIERNKNDGIVAYALREAFDEALTDDFNTPKAFGAIFEFIKRMNTDLTSDSIGQKGAEEASQMLSYINSILGIVPDTQDEIPPAIEVLVEKREKFREEKNFKESDKIRTQIQNLGYEIEDTIYGSLLTKKSS